MAAIFGEILKEWRVLRRFSQLDLSMEAALSARHLSFLESGRSKPSRDMVLRLAEALQWPKATTNQALHAAGFAPVFPDLPGNAPDLAPVQQAIGLLLHAHDPLPAVALDRHWNITESNKGAALLTNFAAASGSPNLIELLINAAGSDLIENWEEVAVLTLTRLRTEILELGGEEILSNMARRLASHDRLKGQDIGAINLEQAVIPTIFRAGEMRLSLFSAIAQFGTVQDVKAGETRIELMFAADEPTAHYFQNL